MVLGEKHGTNYLPYTTYKEDKDYVVKSFAKLIEDGVYQRSLFEDLK